MKRGWVRDPHVPRGYFVYIVVIREPVNHLYDYGLQKCRAIKRMDLLREW